MIKNNFNEILKKAQSENRAALFIFVTGYHPNYETSKLIINGIQGSIFVVVFDKLKALL